MPDPQQNLSQKGEHEGPGGPLETPAAETPRWVVVGGIVGLVFAVLWAAFHHGGFADHGAAKHETEHVHP